LAKQITLGKSKISYCLPFGIGPYCKDYLLEEVRSAVIPFSIKFDESPTNVKGDNQLDIYVVYWSKKI